MKFTLLLWILPSISAYLYSLEDVNVKCPATPEKVEIRAGGPLNGYTQFYGIPAESDEDASFNLIEVIINTTYNTKLEYPENAKISSFPIETSDVPKSCYAATEPLNLKGVIYFVDKNYTDMDVYQSRGNNYTVEISKNYTTVFSRKSTGSTLGSFVTDNDTSFEIHSGLPGDNDNLIFQYDSSQKVDQLYIAQNYFYVLNSGKPFSFTVSDKIVDPSTTTFGLNGFIMSPNFPAAPPDSYKDLNVKLEKREVEKMIKVKVSAIQSPDVEKAGEEGIVLDEKPSVTVKFGKFIG
ncbi:hypothetical protein GCK72_013924 [Caenorhabditis remanei]|uniref:Uncharacterized protein n=1 Tax=Caenorhabditis remanei TaxID=31234 RepID=A0A6A5GPS5_CAERE|nr:hypothetical protein GCK72_013924 [Caenorhabditis remanei]KAF1757468.1 hypothetical protein GCK72_013924 [Caenorhabditis remanei]